ncbi:MAG: hypothetical protein MK096_15105 [Oleiphilaceae bacterium]|nr:hypothetical protein [Oleiphilaceae bacterium]
MKKLALAVLLTSFVGCSTLSSTSNGIEISGVNDALEDTIKVSSFPFSKPFLGVLTAQTGGYIL